MATKIAKTSTIHGKRLQAVTIATTNLAMGTEAIGFENGVVFGVFVDVAMLCYRQSEKKPAKAPLTQKYGCVVAPMPPWLRHGTTSCHVCIAEARKARCVLAEMRWRWTLNL